MRPRDLFQVWFSIRVSSHSFVILSRWNLLQYWYSQSCFLRCCLSLRFIELSLPVLASSFCYLYIESFMWPTVKIGAFFLGSNAYPLLFLFFCFCPFYFCPLLLLPSLNHSIDISRCYITFNILLSVTSRLKRISDNQSTPRMLLSREQISILLSRLSQRRYRIALLILLNIYGAISDPLILMCLSKSRLNQTSYSTGPPRLSYTEPYE